MAHLTRWSDNDMYGHLNNARYYELFDTTINTWIAEHTGGDFAHKDVIGVVAESGCRFHSEAQLPRARHRRTAASSAWATPA